MTTNPAAASSRAELARELAAVGAGPPGADDRHRAVRRRAAPAGPDRRGRTAPRAHRRRRAGRPDRAGRGGSRPSTAPPPDRPRRRLLRHRCDPAPGPARRLRRRGRGEILVREAQQLGRARARPRRWRPSRCTRRGGPPATRAAGSRRRPGGRSFAVPPAQLERLGHLLAPIASPPARSAIVRASRSTRSRPRPLSRRRA